MYSGDVQEFWKLHSEGKPEGFFSEDFKDLITGLL
jgi:hypothetical protein